VTGAPDDLHRLRALDPQSPAMLRPRHAFAAPGSDWSLTQAGWHVGLIEMTDEGSWLEGLGERWSVRVGRGRVGFLIEFARAGAVGPTLTYRPNLRAGGSFEYAGQHRYRLAVSPLRGFWTLIGERRVKLAKIRYVRASGGGVAGMDLEPYPAAVTEPRLLVLLLASCFVLITQPAGGGGGGG
jgi:hypothetical protein